MDILFAMQDAKFVQVNGKLFLNQYTCDPQHTHKADDIVLEVAAEDGEFELTFDEVKDADEIERGSYRLRSGVILSFLNPPTIH